MGEPHESDDRSQAGRSPNRAALLGFYLYLVVATALPSQWLFWDDIGFLLAARAGELDYGHLLYIPAISAFQLLLTPLTGAEEYAAKLFSMLGGAVAFLLLWNRFGRGRSRANAAVLALLVTASPLFWRQLSLIEPSTWTLACLLLSANAAEAYGRRRGIPALLVASVCFGATVGFHLVSLAALPWLAWLARGPAARPALRELAVPVVLLGAGLAVAEVFGDPIARGGAFFGYWRGFLADAYAKDQLETLTHVLGSGAPALSVAFLFALPFVGRRARGELAGPLLLGLPYLTAFLLFGKPVVGLLLPFTLAMGLLVAAGERLWNGLAPRVTEALLATALTAQAFVALAFALHEATTPDREREAAVLLAGALPEDAILVAGPLAHHLRWYTGAPVVALPNLLHQSIATGKTDLTTLELIRAEARARLEDHAAVYVTNEALEYLSAYWGLDPGDFPQDPQGVIEVRAEPVLRLIPIARR